MLMHNIFRTGRPIRTSNLVGFLHADGSIPCRPHLAATQIVIFKILLYIIVLICVCTIILGCSAVVIS